MVGRGHRLMRRSHYMGVDSKIPPLISILFAYKIFRDLPVVNPQARRNHQCALWAQQIHFYEIQE